MRGKGLVILAGLILAACQQQRQTVTSGGEGRWAELPVALNVSQEIYDSQAAMTDIAAAMEFWEERAGRRLFDLRGPWNAAPSPVVGDLSNPSFVHTNIIFFPTSWPIAFEVAGKTTILTQGEHFSQGYVALNRDRTYCFGSCEYDYFRVGFRRLVTHELGHFIGLNHVNDNANIMAPALASGGNLDSAQVDMAALSRLTNF